MSYDFFYYTIGQNFSPFLANNFFSRRVIIKKKKDYYKLGKEFFLKTLLENLNSKTKIVSSTGYNSREIIYLRNKNI